MPASDSGILTVIDEPLSAEPGPLWPDAPRLCPARAFPEYRYVRGVNLRPRRRADDHSYGRARETQALSKWDWHENEDFLFGIDLYHAAYLWESHEPWEELLGSVPDDSPESNLLQALAMNSAAQIAALESNARRTRVRSQEARWRLARIRAKGFTGPDSRFFGFDIGDLIDQIVRHYAPVWKQDEEDNVRLKGPVPRLLPQQESNYPG